MPVQGRRDFINNSIVLFGEPLHKDSEVIKQDAGRATPLAFGTIMAQVAATRKWVPLTDVAALDGTNTARGIYLGEAIPAAGIVAGDVVAPIAVAGISLILDASQIVLENGLTLNSVCSDDPAGADNGVVNVRRIEDDLFRIGIFTKGTYDVMNYENA